MTSSTNRDSDRFIVRLPDGMRDRIKAAAAVGGRSMNAEIVRVLEAAFPEPAEISLAEEIRQVELALVDISQLIQGGFQSSDEKANLILLLKYQTERLEELQKKSAQLESRRET
ncbi:Arc family DNA-binding protein [Phaeobacter gallaeciensis]|jgi:plasmid stability protein|uniref:Arc family DNA-binding protein n=1 Tax=Phaeobacter gallaeciensis TaxID=60890 RepID=UPI00237FC407|nr:Arc family DNA-binding protein [Phaeobacter gallaeciensis]MDE4303645.1 Arc family DNA-binding protein [Phaeobacter gallaeciensis]MDE4307874.1 Arc family DNA-binding protein [Phaeobacter gallaeciensis]MDE4312332.1 Arc family DNA-binding protein [Phaeobacter gallaeciensis]MDE4316803.1 Arc family DNA-binding protein [Phaeobacter gallaeciensis]MDE4321266.1 Arc family DNA-binding protein [Phaeobacter gallaeciensis]